MEFDSKLIRKHILINAVEHGGTAQAKSVLGMIMSEKPELRSNVLQLKSEIERLIPDINSMTLNAQKKELAQYGGYTPQQKKERKGLPELELGREKFVVRFAPNPDGAIHLGNTRPAILSDEYRKKYNGNMILRFDDTDPKIKVPEKKFYKWIKEDLKWLKIKIHKEVTASGRLKIYYKHAEELIKKEKAYVCTCRDEWKRLRDKSKPCPCRLLPVREQQKRWKMMLNAGKKGKSYKEGEAVLRIKTDLNAKNPAVRDWPAIRIVDNPKHPLVKAHVWPLYNFASAIDDHLLGVTHIFRGQEHSTNEVKQQYLYDHLRWKHPIVITLGRFSISDMVLSKSEIRAGIKQGKYVGWDAPSLSTIRALKRRGFTPEAIRNIIVDIGPKSSDVTISLENLAAYNRKIIDSKANRYFFVENMKFIKIKGLKNPKVKLPLHPEVKRGYRKLNAANGIYIEKQDFEKYKSLEVHLMGLCNVKLGETAVYTSKEKKPIPKIHWVPKKYIGVRVLVPGKVVQGIAETNLAKAKKGDHAQFERFGFVRIEKVAKNNVVAVFGHK